MAQSFTNILVHLVFSTKRRYPFIQPVDVENRLHQYMAVLFKKNDCIVHIIGGIDNHVHILISISRNIPLCKIVADVKANSSRWIKTLGANYREFSWQSGYGGFSIGQSGYDDTKKYIQNQKEHHKKINFENEFLKLLDKYNIPYDKNSLWED